DKGLVIRREVDRFLRSLDVTVAVEHEFDNIENIKKAVEIDGVALLPEPTLRRGGGAGHPLPPPPARPAPVPPPGPPPPPASSPPPPPRPAIPPVAPPARRAAAGCHRRPPAGHGPTTPSSQRPPACLQQERVMSQIGFPPQQGLYDPRYEHDACGVGFLVDLKGRKSHDIVDKAVQTVRRLDHRGACGCEKNTGDGAGILLQMPHRFLAEQCDRLNVRLPDPGGYGVGMVFLPADPAERHQCAQLFEKIVREEGQTVVGWRTVPTDDAPLGPTAREAQPAIRQIFIGRGRIERDVDDLAFERKLYVIRKRVEHAVKHSGLAGRGMFYVPSLSYKTL